MNKDKIIDEGWVNPDGSPGKVNPFETIMASRPDLVELSLGVESGSITVSQAMAVAGMKLPDVEPSKGPITGNVVQLPSAGRDRPSFAIVQGNKSIGMPFIPRALAKQMIGRKLGKGTFNFDTCHLEEVEIDGEMVRANPDQDADIDI